jgi:uncharacterized protein YjbI with pentapeptide repeats
MNRKYIFPLCLVLLLALAGCSKRPHSTDALQEGARQLGYEEILVLLTDKSLHIVNWDKSVEADVTFAGSGKLSGENNVGEKTGGRWKVEKDNTLCIRYDQWAERSMQCYAVYEKDEGFQMFRADGGLESTFTVTGGGETRFSGVGLGQSMPGGSKAEESDSAPVRSQVIPDTNAASSAAATETKRDSWWKFNLFGKDTPEESPAAADYVAPPPALSREMTHLLDEKECVHCDLTGQNLRNASLKNADLEEADLSGADLTGAFLPNANLKRAKLAGAKLSAANLEGADLTDADLSGANLEGANLEDAALGAANLSRARLVDAVLVGAVLKNADLAQANLHWANLTKADLSGASLKGSYLVKTLFFKADLTNADLTDAVIQRTNFDSVQGYTPPAAESDSGKKEEKKDKLFGLF